MMKVAIHYYKADTEAEATEKGRLAKRYGIPVEAPPSTYNRRQRRAWVRGWIAGKR